MKNEKEENPGEIADNINEPSAVEGPDKTGLKTAGRLQHIMHRRQNAASMLRSFSGKDAWVKPHKIPAYGHYAIAGEYLNDDAKRHSQALKETKYQ